MSTTWLSDAVLPLLSVTVTPSVTKVVPTVYVSENELSPTGEPFAVHAYVVYVPEPPEALANHVQVAFGRTTDGSVIVTVSGDGGGGGT